MPTTLVHALVPSSCLALTHRAQPELTAREWGKLLLWAAIAGNLADLDLVPVIFFPGAWRIVHRYLGHNLVTLTLLVILAKWALERLVSPKLSGRRAWGLSLPLVASHVFLDAFCVGAPGETGGVPLLFPFSRWELEFPWKIFPLITVPERVHPLVDVALAADYWRRVLFIELGYSALFVAGWACLWGASRLFVRLARRTPNDGARVTPPRTESASPSGRSSPKCNPEPPSRLPPGDSPNHTYTGS